MDKEIKDTLKKTAKIAGVTCVTAGAVALIASGAALKAAVSGIQYIKDRAEEILKEAKDEPQVVDIDTEEEAAAEPEAEVAAEAEPEVPAEEPEVVVKVVVEPEEPEAE